MVFEYRINQSLISEHIIWPEGSRKFLIFSESLGSVDRYDAVLVGGGIMSATLASLLSELEPGLRLLIVERLGSPALESSSALNNAGTGHAANCELNYTPMRPNGCVDTSKALVINTSFERSLEYWASLKDLGKLDTSKFLHRVPHISFVSGENDVAFLRKRFEEMKKLSAFSSMRWSNDSSELSEWMPLVMAGRSSKNNFAATSIERGTDIDFGALTCGYLESIRTSGVVDLLYQTEVTNLQRLEQKQWELEIKGESGIRYVRAPFVFLGAGGGALPLLQKSGIPEAAIYGGFPVSGQWLVCSDQGLSKRHNAKVYGKAKVGAPPMSVPHLDTRWIAGSRSLLFGPFAGYTTKFLKQGSSLDLYRSLTFNNLGPSLQVGLKNLDLVVYLVNQARQSQEDRINALMEFFPNAEAKDWNLELAGQRVQIIKRTSRGSVLQMGTEVVTSKDGSLAALLGASPGASTAVQIMLEVLQSCWTEKVRSEKWQKKLHKLLPSFGQDLINQNQLLAEIRKRNDMLLDLS